jgi:hypothetical protein
MLQLRLSAAWARASDFIQKIEQATAALQAERQMKGIVGGTVEGGLVEIHELENLAVISDLHGDSYSLFRILDEINYPAQRISWFFWATMSTEAAILSASYMLSAT